MLAYPGRCRHGRSAHKGLLLIAGVAVLSTLQPSPSQALNEKNYTGGCKSELLKWRKRGGYGAAAVATNGYCGFSWDAFSLEDARRWALAYCRKGKKAKGCVVTSTLNTPSKLVRQSRLCGSMKGQQSIDACTLLLAKKGGDKATRAWHLKERGRNYKALGIRGRAIADFTESIKIYPKGDDVYFDRGQLYVQLGLLKEAAKDFQQSIRNYNRTDRDYRSEADSQLKWIEAELVDASTLDDQKLCTLALNNSLSGWDDSKQNAVREIERRKLTLDACLTAKFATFNSKWVCTVAYDRTTSAWSADPTRERYVTEANVRKLTIDNCRKQLAP